MIRDDDDGGSLALCLSRAVMVPPPSKTVALKHRGVALCVISVHALSRGLLCYALASG